MVNSRKLSKFIKMITANKYLSIHIDLAEVKRSGTGISLSTNWTNTRPCRPSDSLGLPSN